MIMITFYFIGNFYPVIVRPPFYDEAKPAECKMLKNSFLRTLIMTRNLQFLMEPENCRNNWRF